MMKSSHEGREEQQSVQAFGTSTLGHARELLRPFDHDGNGSISLVNDTGISSLDETIATEKRKESDSHVKYDWMNDEFRTDTERWEERRQVSARTVFTFANTDGDDVVTDREVARLMAGSDTDQSGTLTKAERADFNEMHPVVWGQWERS